MFCCANNVGLAPTGEDNNNFLLLLLFNNEKLDNSEQDCE